MNFDKEILSVPEACEFLNIKKSTLYKLTHYRRLPYYRPTGGRLYFLRADLEAWMLQNFVPSERELDGRASEVVKKLLKN